MTLPYDRKFNKGRQSELLMDEELHRTFESVKHITETPPNGAQPEAKINGALWLEQNKNELKAYHKPTKTWKNIFSEKFQITDQILNSYPSAKPVQGQLWIYNDVLCYWTGTEWKPVKTITQDDSNFDLSLFKNHLLIAPLSSTGGTVVDEESLSHYKEAMRSYRQGKQDLINDSKLTGDGTKWEFDKDTDLAYGIDYPTIEGNMQFLVPDTRKMRIFIDGILDNNYQEKSTVCIEYPKNLLSNKKSALIHVNPGKLKKIEKKLIEIDKLTGHIYFDDVDYELYGFKKGDPLGDLLLPEVEQDDGGYILIQDGVILSYDQTQNYDYVLIVNFDFGYLKATGTLTKKWNKDGDGMTFAIKNFSSPHNLFVDGFNLEETSFIEDTLAGTITINEPINGSTLNGFHTHFREMGFIREVDLQGKGIIKTFHKYNNPLIFVNGVVVNGIEGFEQEGKVIKIPGASVNMVWAIAELQNGDENMFVASGVVPSNKYISYSDVTFEGDDNLILFVDGLLVSDQDVEWDRRHNTVTATGITPGQDYIILKDTHDWFYKEENFTPAMNVGKVSETLVYLNGHLIINGSALICSKNNPEGYNNQIKFFLEMEDHQTRRGYYARYETEYDNEGNDISAWHRLTEEETTNLEKIVNSYDNATKSISLNTDNLLEAGVEYNSATDDLRIFSFKYASYDGQPLTIGSFAVRDENDTLHTEDMQTFTIKDYYVPNENRLSVFIDGILQYDVAEEAILNEEKTNRFSFADKIQPPCVISYIIASPDYVGDNQIRRIRLNHENIIPGTTNIYRTYKTNAGISEENKPSLYPGRVVVYVNGVRQPSETFTILDNYTIMFNDVNTALIGTASNYPDEILLDKDKLPVKTITGENAVVHHTKSDDILIEVKQETNKREEHFLIDTNSQSFAVDLEQNDIPLEILETNDEVLIFVDGLFTGLKNNDGSKFTYSRDTSQGLITINSPDVIESIVTDPLYKFFKLNPSAALKYRNKHGEEYKPKKKDLILEWRSE